MVVAFDVKEEEKEEGSTRGHKRAWKKPLTDKEVGEKMVIKVFLFLKFNIHFDIIL